ncbi:hypothetical protein ACFQRC_07290 [Enterovirga sp. GCM10030262]|uniref:hypothetical protein n=1 Tax=Enterovirga sp. GCM10030262 TaxID=3273391 RepID=UPI00360B11B8
MDSSIIVGWALIVALLTILWVLVCIPAFALLAGWRRIGTESPAETARWFLDRRPDIARHYSAFRVRFAAAADTLSGATVRVMVDRLHRRLRRNLAAIRAEIDRRLQRISSASTAREGGTLVDLLQSFKADTDRALEFGTLEDGFVDNSVARSKARLSASLAIAFALIIAAANFGLLYMFFNEAYPGRIPYLDIKLAVALALFFPLVEAAAGVAGEILNSSSTSALIRSVGVAVIVAVMVALGALEFVIFYQLFGELFRSLEAFPRDSLMHTLVALVGAALTVLQAIFGFVAARSLLHLRELGTYISIRDQVADARAFVDGLESRYAAIDNAAAGAARSIDELAAQLRGRGEAELPVASALAEQRDALRAAIDEVNPEKWPADVAASDADRTSIAAQAWLFPILVLAALAFFTLAAGATIERSAVAGPDAWLEGILVAFAAGIAAIIAGAHLFDRATLAYQSGDEWRDAISPRDSAFRVFALVILVIASIGTLWLCIHADGWLGLAEGLLLVAILLALAVAGSYLDLLLRGLAFLAVVLGLAIVLTFLMLVLSAWTALLVFGAILAFLVHALAALLAWPLAWALSLRSDRNSAQASASTRMPTRAA